MSPAYQAIVRSDYFDIIVRNCEIFVNRLEEKLDWNEFNIFPYVTDLSVDIIAGKNSKSLETILLFVPPNFWNPGEMHGKLYAMDFYLPFFVFLETSLNVKLDVQKGLYTDYSKNIDL